MRGAKGAIVTALLVGLVALGAAACGDEGRSAPGDVPPDGGGFVDTAAPDAADGTAGDAPGDATGDAPGDGAGETAVGGDGAAAGEPCSAHGDCASGVCMARRGERECAAPCDEGACPEGLTCRSVEHDGGETTEVCLSPHAQLCRPCTEAKDCQGPTGTIANRCVDLGADGQFCASACGEGGVTCPEGYACQEAQLAGGETEAVCLPGPGGCTCPASSAEAGETTPCTRSNEHGSCEGERACEADGSLTSCDAPEPDAESCNGIDDDCDGQTDEVPEQGMLCEDAAEPHVVTCQDGTCQEPPCECPKPPTCRQVAGCNPDGSCEIADAPDGTPCDDGDPATVDDQCVDGSCEGEPCDCPDPGPCRTIANCGEGPCGYEAVENGTPCDDGDPSTDNDRCIDGTCEGEPTGCECDDLGPCEQKAGCNPDGSCSVEPVPDGTPCDDGNPCTEGESCQAGSCDGEPVECVGPPDSGPCVESTCDPASGGCVVGDAPDGTPCDDGDPDTCGDTCQGGTCTGGSCPAGPPEGVRVADAAGATVGEPEPAVAADGTMWAVYPRPEDELALARSQDGGGSFEVLGPVHDADTVVDWTGDKALEVDAGGNLHVVFDVDEDPPCRYAQSTDGGATFGGYADVLAVSQHSEDCGMTVPETGHVLFAWPGSETGDYPEWHQTIFAAEPDVLDGSFDLDPATQVAEDASTSVAHAMALRPEPGVVVVLWETADHDVLAARSTDGGESFGSATRVNDAVGEASVGATRFAAVDAQGHVYVVWWVPTTVGDEQVYLDVSTDGGQSWGTDQLLTDATDQSDPVVAPLGGGGAFAVWEGDERIRGRRIGASGAPVGEARPMQADDEADKDGPGVATGGPNGETILVVWRDDRESGGWTVYGSVVEP